MGILASSLFTACKLGPMPPWWEDVWLRLQAFASPCVLELEKIRLFRANRLLLVKCDDNKMVKLLWYSFKETPPCI